MENWENLVVSEQTTLREVMVLFERYGAQIALVADSHRMLLGVVTDGDMRRSLLKNITLTDPIKDTMNKTPITVTPDVPPEEILKKFDLLGMKYLPVVDENKVIQGIYRRSDFIQTQKQHTPVVIMAGGEGLRLRPLTKNLPKPLININGTPIIEMLFTKLIEQGFNQFFLSINYLGEMIEAHFGDGKKWGVNIQYLREEKKLGTGGALNFLRGINTDLILLNGDLVTNVNFKMLLEHHKKTDASVTVGVKKAFFRVPYGVVHSHDVMIHSLEEKPILQYNTNCGVYALAPYALDWIPEGAPIDMPCLINRLLEANKRVIAFPVYEEWHDVGNVRDLERLQNLYAYDE